MIRQEKDPASNNPAIEEPTVEDCDHTTEGPVVEVIQQDKDPAVDNPTIKGPVIDSPAIGEVEFRKVGVDAEVTRDSREQQGMIEGFGVYLVQVRTGIG